MILTKARLTAFSYWLRYQKDLRPRTIDTYEKRIRYLAHYLEQREFDYKNCQLFLIYLKQQNKEPATISLSRTVIIEFIKFIQSEDPSFEDFSSKLPQVKVREKPIEVLTVSEIDSIINCKRTYKYPHLQEFWDVLLSMIARTGRRVGEIRTLQKEDIDLTQNAILLRDPKNGQPRWIPAPKELLIRLDRLSEKGFIFVTPFTNGRPISGVSIRNELRNRTKLLGITKRIHPHKFRHSYPVEILRKHISIAHVQQLMGHKRIQSTLRYLHLVLDDLQVASASHPLNQAELAAKDIVKAIEKEINRYSLSQREDLDFEVTHKKKEFNFTIRW